ncbi:MAG TPA: universal stress protein [Flavobacterium sp.]|uniref:universal stress protein n=1 Tax=Flavobacterium sp. TaxID=239 RepID=UPI002C8FE1F9|nr:universal stress protein [Flavobacterium sp.]HNP33735.1 universal stress protein [Flavobacterium sp.]
MKKIVVPVDFSANSKKAVRFAIQLASKTKSEIIFLHIVKLMSPTTDVLWDYAYYSQFQEDGLKASENYLIKLIKRLYNKNLPAGVNYKCVCLMSAEVSNEIIDYAKKHKADFICIGASGTNFLGKLFGTVTTQMIIHSPIPVFVIPKNYRNKPLTEICYASDMENPEPEITNVISLTKALQAKLNVIHYDYEIGLEENKEKLTYIANKFMSKNIKFNYRELDALYPLNEHLRKAVEELKPSLVVLFTKQDRRWFDRMMISSNSVDMSFSIKVPLLVFRKPT